MYAASERAGTSSFWALPLEKEKRPEIVRSFILITPIESLVENASQYIFSLRRCKVSKAFFRKDVDILRFLMYDPNKRVPGEHQ